MIALVGWLGLGVWVLVTDEHLPPNALWGIGFFITFFLVFAMYYWRMVYVVDETGVTVAGATDCTHFPWETIESVRRSDFPLGGWEVSTNQGVFVLDRFVGHHARLLDVIVARAGLFEGA